MVNKTTNLLRAISKLEGEGPMPLPKYAAFLEANERPLVERIQAKGLAISSFWNDLVNPKLEYEKHLPDIADVLLAALEDPELHPRILGGVVLALGNKTVAKKRNLFDYFYDRYLEIPSSKNIKNPQARGLDECFANALVGHFRLEDLEKLKTLLNTESLGESRILLLRALRKHRNVSSVQSLLLSLRGISTFEKELKATFKVG